MHPRKNHQTRKGERKMVSPTEIRRYAEVDVKLDVFQECNKIERGKRAELKSFCMRKRLTNLSALKIGVFKTQKEK